MIKEGDMVYCKKSFNVIGLFKGKMYKVGRCVQFVHINPDRVIKTDFYINNFMFSVMGEDDITAGLQFSDHFYYPSELRKLKLKQIIND